jgi:transposase
MGIYKEGLNRKQQLMFPPSLDGLVDENNMVRAIEEYVNILDISQLKIRSSRKLELEITRNIEMMWLTQGLRPSYKTIANFRKNNLKALQTIFREFSTS